MLIISAVRRTQEVVWHPLALTLTPFCMDFTCSVSLNQLYILQFPPCFRFLCSLLIPALFLSGVLCTCLAVLLCGIRLWIQGRRKQQNLAGRDGRQPLLVAFFHPYCNAGGGGERVLWCAIRTLQKK